MLNLDIFVFWPQASCHSLQNDLYIFRKFLHLSSLSFYYYYYTLTLHSYHASHIEHPLPVDILVLPSVTQKRVRKKKTKSNNHFKTCRLCI